MSHEVEQYLALSPGEFPVLETLAVSEVVGDNGLEVALSMTFSGASSKRLIVQCQGVRDLAFKQPWTTDMRIHSLEITDLRSAQMEGLQFAVRDLEEEVMEFKCRTVEATRSPS